MESYVPHQVRSLGICNTDLPILRVIYAKSTIEPSVVQNPFHCKTSYDGDVRVYCSERRIQYQGFWTLTANQHLLSSGLIDEVASQVGVSREVALYSCIMSLDVTILNGTTSPDRLLDDRQAVDTFRAWIGSNPQEWNSVRRRFDALLHSQDEQDKISNAGVSSAS
jgi:diketogulonate reductase-like aldo/keto reductase